MPKNIWHFIAKTRMAVILPSVFYALTMFSQTSLSEQLSEVLIANDLNKGFLIYNQISETEIKQLSDSALFDFHYLGAYLNSNNCTETPNHEKVIHHLKEAKRLCDTSLGTYFTGYMEIMKGLGDEYFEEGNFEDALAIYEEGLVKSMAIRDRVPQFFANLIMGIQECYENLGFFSEVPIHLMDAWGMWDKDIEPFCRYNYFPLWTLQQFYSKYECFENALKINDEIVKFIQEKGGANHPEMAEALFYRGNHLNYLNKYEEATETYRQALKILDSNKLTDEDLYEYILGNLVLASTETDSIRLTIDILDEIKTHGLKYNNPQIYKNALYSTANKFNERGFYDMALSLNLQLRDLALTQEENAVIEEQHSDIIFNKEIIESLPKLYESFNSLSSENMEWFDMGYKLASAYYLTNEIDKYLEVLKQLYSAIKPDNSLGKDYYYWVLNNLYNVSFDLGDYTAALKYALEKWLEVSSTLDFQEEICISAINNLVAAKLRSAEIEGIDSDLEIYRDLCVKLYGDNSTEYSVYLHNKGRACQLQGDLKEAKRNYLLANTLGIKTKGKASRRTVQYLMEVDMQIVEEGLDFEM